MYDKYKNKYFLVKETLIGDEVTYELYINKGCFNTLSKAEYIAKSYYCNKRGYDLNPYWPVQVVVFTFEKAFKKFPIQLENFIIQLEKKN